MDNIKSSLARQDFIVMSSFIIYMFAESTIRSKRDDRMQ